MNVSLYQAAAAMNANTRWQDVLMENLSGASIPGYKKQELSFSKFAGGLMEQGPNYVLPKTTAITNFDAGEMRNTNLPTDFAIEGDGFFGVAMPDGNTAYTRDGEFHLSAEGKLVTKTGMEVLGEQGSIILDPHRIDTVTVSNSGEIKQGNEIKGKLKVMDFEDPQRLTRLNGGYFLADKSDTQPMESKNFKVRQGFLENSNISPVAEMASLINAMRTMETGQKSIQLQDDRLNQSIRDLGSPD